MMIFSIVRLRIAFSSISFTRFFSSSISVSNKQKGDGNVINSKHNGRSIKTTDIQCVGGVYRVKWLVYLQEFEEEKNSLGVEFCFCGDAYTEIHTNSITIYSYIHYTISIIVSVVLCLFLLCTISSFFFNHAYLISTNALSKRNH